MGGVTTIEKSSGRYGYRDHEDWREEDPFPPQSYRWPQDPGASGTAQQVNRAGKSDRLPMIGEPGYQPPDAWQPAPKYSAYPGLGDPVYAQTAMVTAPRETAWQNKLAEPPGLYMVAAIAGLIALWIFVRFLRLTRG